jgi:hypothetical protein
MTQEQLDALVEQSDKVTIAAVVKRPDKAVIECEADSNQWSLFLADQVTCRKYIEEQFKPIKTAAYDRHKAICAKEKAMIAEFVKGEADANETLTKWVLEENARRAEAQRLADEQKKQDAIADALANGQKTLAKQINSGLIPVASEPVADAVKVAGLNVKMVKKGRITDMALFVEACLKGKGVSISMLLIDDARLERWIKATDGTVPVPGLVVYEEPESRRTRIAR